MLQWTNRIYSGKVLDLRIIRPSPSVKFFFSAAASSKKKSSAQTGVYAGHRLFFFFYYYFPEKIHVTFRVPHTQHTTLFILYYYAYVVLIKFYVTHLCCVNVQLHLLKPNPEKKKRSETIIIQCRKKNKTTRQHVYKIIVIAVIIVLLFCFKRVKKNM